MVYKDLDLAQVEKLASEMATLVKTKKAVIGLIGPLGAGKTTFVKAFAKQFKINKIKSPTFVITHQYKIPQRSLYHMDFYRLHNDKQLIDLGLDEILNSNNVVLIEWIDRFAQIIKRCDILISFSTKGGSASGGKVKKNNKRDVTIQTI